MQSINCLLCGNEKQYNGFLSHIRQQHLSYNRYKCANCKYECDFEEDSILHRLKTSHDLKFDICSYQERLAVRIFEDCYRERHLAFGQTEEHEISKMEELGQKLEQEGGSFSSINEEVDSSEKSRKRNEVIPVASNSNKEETSKAFPDLHRITGESLNYNDKSQEKQENQQHMVTNKSSYDLSDAPNPSDSSYVRSTNLNESFVGKNNDSGGDNDNDNDLIVVSEKILMPVGKPTNKQSQNVQVNSRSQIPTSRLMTTCQKCGKEVDVHYVARKEHALQFHFTRNDDPEISDLLPATVQACFPLFLTSNDNQCTECGKIISTVDSRRNHVMKEHFCWSAVCPVAGCAALITTIVDLKNHFMQEHNIEHSNKAKELQLKLRKLRNKWKSNFREQLEHCFPCAPQQKKRTSSRQPVDDNESLPRATISSLLSSILYSQNASNNKRNKIPSNLSSSDTSSSGAEDESDSEGNETDSELRKKTKLSYEINENNR